jgi:hypothetical protein
MCKLAATAYETRPSLSEAAHLDALAMLTGWLPERRRVDRAT